MATTGCQWAMIPNDFPPPSTVQRYFYDWHDSGLLRTINHHLVMEALRRHDIYHDVWQCPTVLVPLDLAGTGGELVVVRPIRSQRAMTAASVDLPATMLDELREGVLGLEGISGLAVDLTSKPPGTIEWE